MQGNAIKFPTGAQVEARAAEIINGIGFPYIPVLPGLTFQRLGLAQRGESSRAYSRFLKEDMAQGGRFAEALLPTELRRRCTEVGIDYDDLTVAAEELQRRVFDTAPADLRDAAPRLTDEEFAAMSTEEQELYNSQLRERGLRIKEFLEGLFSPAEKAIRAQVDQVKLLETQLRYQTYEHHARVHQRLVEIQLGARTETGEPYFASIDEIAELEQTDVATYLILCERWREFLEGRWPGFMPRSSSAR